MPSDIQQQQTSYKKMMHTWHLVRDAVEGEAAIKRQDEYYLPMPAGMVDATSPATASTQRSITSTEDQSYEDTEYNPNSHNNPAYASYKTRATVPDITGFTLRGLLGLAIHKYPSVELPDSMAVMEKQMENMYKRSLSEVLQAGRFGILLDISEEGNIIMVPYVAESIINWRAKRSEDGDFRGLEYVVLEEEVPSAESKYSVETVKQYRVLEIVDGKYTSTLYNEADEIMPNAKGETATVGTYKGKTLDIIPFVFFGSTDNDPEPDTSPLAAIAGITIQIYMKSADLSQAEFTSCNPTLIYTGIKADDVPRKMGSTVAVALPDPDSKAFYTVTDTGALQHVQNHITSLFEQAAAYGAHLLSGSKKSAESGEALRLRQSASSSSLVSVVMTVGNGYKLLFDIAAKWIGTTEEVEFIPITDFTDMALTAQEMVALVNAWMNGALSLPTVVDVFRRAGVLQKDSTVEDELALIAEQGPPAITGMGGSMTGDEDEDEDEINENLTPTNGGDQ